MKFNMRAFTRITALLLIISIMFTLTGCYDASGIEELAYVVALGLDLNENNEFELSVQIATSGSNSSSSSQSNNSSEGNDSSASESSSSSGTKDSSSGNTSQSSNSNVTTIKCNTIDTGLSLINNHISKKLNLSHCQVILISESLAAQGINTYLDSLLNNSELRNDCSIIITKCSAKDYLNNVNPALESLTARYYESTINSAKYAGYTIDITLFEFYSKMKDSCSQAYAILGTKLSKNQIENPVEENANYTAGNNPIKDKDVIDNLGIAVFRDDKLVGELSGLDSICHILINNELKSCVLSIPSAGHETKYVDLRLTSEKKTRCSVNFVNSTPHITIDIYLVAQGLSMDNTLNYDSTSQLNSIQSNATEYITREIHNYLYKTSRAFGSDICGFGKYALKNYLTIQDWYDSNWLGNYKNAEFDVHVHLKLKSGNLFDQS